LNLIVPPWLTLMLVANPWMLGSPAPLMSHWLEGLPGSAFSATISFGTIEMLSARGAVCAPLLSWIVKFDTPVAVGVPEITPVVERSVRPAGSAPVLTVHVSGGVPPLLVRVAVYGTFTAPSGSDVVVMARPPGGRIVRVVVSPSSPRDAEMVDVPWATPVARPPAAIVATAVLDELQVTWLVTFCVLPSEYVPVAAHCCVAPIATAGLSGVTAIDVSDAVACGVNTTSTQ